jgi:hypothetical protein
LLNNIDKASNGHQLVCAECQLRSRVEFDDPMPVCQEAEKNDGLTWTLFSAFDSFNRETILARKVKMIEYCFRRNLVSRFLPAKW